MSEVLLKALSFVAIIVLGYLLRRFGFFHEDDFHVLSKIVLKITLPAAIISNFSSVELQPSMLLLSLLGLGGGLLLMGAGFLLGHGRKERAFCLLNTSGYNIGNFTMPFAQSFLGPVGVVVTSLFDTGNALICLGGSYSVASMVEQPGSRFSLRRLCATLLKSVPFDAYLVMTFLSLCHLSLPAPVLSIAGIISGANAFLAMLMIGVGFHLSGDRSQRGKILRILAVRYGISLALAAVFFFLLPLPLAYRQALAVLAVSPIASAAPAFTAELKADYGLASAVNSLSIVISIVLMTLMLTLML